jgi:hypothetical protein
VIKPVANGSEKTPFDANEAKEDGASVVAGAKEDRANVVAGAKEDGAHVVVGAGAGADKKEGGRLPAGDAPTAMQTTEEVSAEHVVGDGSVESKSDRFTHLQVKARYPPSP